MEEYRFIVTDYSDQSREVVASSAAEALEEFNEWNDGDSYTLDDLRVYDVKSGAELDIDEII